MLTGHKLSSRRHGRRYLHPSNAALEDLMTKKGFDTGPYGRLFAATTPELAAKLLCGCSGSGSTYLRAAPCVFQYPGKPTVTAAAAATAAAAEAAVVVGTTGNGSNPDE